MADYSVDIAVALKGAKKLTDFNKTVDNTTKNIKALNHNLKTTSKDQKLVIKSFDNLNKVLSTAKSNFNSVASGTKLQTKAARQLIAAEKQLNREYNQRENLLNRLRGTGPMPLPGTGVGRDPVASSIERRRRKLMRGANQYSSPLGPFQASPLQMIPGFGMGSLQGQTSPVGDKIARALENEKRLVKEVEAIRGRASTRRTNNTKRQLSLEKKSNDFIKKAIKEEAALRKKAENEANALAQKRRDRNRGLRKKASGAISSGLIGGGFPLLFGQGPIAALGGGIGGLAGGMIGGQAGFALSIAGTTIAGAMDDLANALAKPTENIQKLVDKFGLAGTSSGDLALKLEKLGLKSAAAALLLEEGQEKFGLTADEIEENTKKLQEFKNSINTLGTELTLFLSDALQPIINDLMKFRKGKGVTKGIVDFILYGPGGDPTTSFKTGTKGGRGMSNIPPAEGDAIINGIPLNPKSNKTNNQSIKTRLNDLAKIAEFNKNILPLQQAFEIEQKRFTLSSNNLDILKAKNDVINAENTLFASLEELDISRSRLKGEDLENLEKQIKAEKILLQTAVAKFKNAEDTKKLNDMRTEASLADLDRQIQLEQQRFDLLPKEIKILQQKNQLSSLESSLVIAKEAGNQKLVASLTKQIELQQILINQSMILANPIEAEIVLLDQQMKQLIETGALAVGLSQTIGSSFENSFKGVITGTMAVTDAFRNMLNRIGDYFLDLAAQVL